MEGKLFDIRKNNDNGVDGNELAMAVISRALADVKRLEEDCLGTKARKKSKDHNEKFRDGISAVEFLVSEAPAVAEVREMWCCMANLDSRLLRRVKKLFPAAIKVAAQWGAV